MMTMNTVKTWQATLQNHEEEMITIKAEYNKIKTGSDDSETIISEIRREIDELKTTTQSQSIKIDSLQVTNET